MWKYYRKRVITISIYNLDYELSLWEIKYQPSRTPLESRFMEHQINYPIPSVDTSYIFDLLNELSTETKTKCEVIIWKRNAPRPTNLLFHLAKEDCLAEDIIYQKRQVLMILQKR